MNPTFFFIVVVRLLLAGILMLCFKGGGLLRLAFFVLFQMEPSNYSCIVKLRLNVCDCFFLLGVGKEGGVMTMVNSLPLPLTLYVSVFQTEACSLICKLVLFALA